VNEGKITVDDFSKLDTCPASSIITAGISKLEPNRGD
jgi:hypothetical protein